MGKELVVYKQKIKRANIASKSTGIAKGDIWKKASKEQRFLGKTLPKMLLGAAKFAWKHPITTAATWIGGELGYKKATKGRKWLTRKYQSIEGSQRKIARGKLYQGGHYDV